MSDPHSYRGLVEKLAAIADSNSDLRLEERAAIVDAMLALERHTPENGDQERLARKLDETVIMLQREKAFSDCIRNLVSGGAFDLTDSPKSFICQVQRLVREFDEPFATGERQA